MAESLSLHEYLIQLYDYNDWANQRYLSVAAGLPLDQLFHNHAQSWGSVHGMLAHIMNAEWIWLRRWQGESPTDFPDNASIPTIEGLWLHYNGIEAEIRRFLASQTALSLMRDVTYTNTKGISYTLKLWEMMAHVANHGTHHRGELAAMFALMNVPHPEEDWLLYFRERSGQGK